jgi:hypothetical protein
MGLLAGCGGPEAVEAGAGSAPRQQGCGDHCRSDYNQCTQEFFRPEEECRLEMFSCLEQCAVEGARLDPAS